MAVATEGLEKLEDMIVRQAEATGAQVAAAKAAIGSVIFGQEGVVEQALITVLCGRHALLIGLPGLAKTKLVETMGIVLGLDARRIQFTPDCTEGASWPGEASVKKQRWATRRPPLLSQGRPHEKGEAMQDVLRWFRVILTLLEEL